MDKPLGSRQPDKRHAAYEDIFGRPSLSHHQPSYPQNQYLYSYQANLDKNATFASQYNHQSHYRQPYYPPPQQNYQQRPQYPYPNSLSPPIHHSRPNSANNAPHPARSVTPQPEEPPDPSFEALTRSGLTPAQAYQAQVYLDSPAAQRRYNHPNDYSSYPQNGGPSNLQDSAFPRLAVPLEQDGGRLGVNFSNRSSSDLGTDEGSELPWVQKDRYTRASCF